MIRYVTCIAQINFQESGPSLYAHYQTSLVHHKNTQILHLMSTMRKLLHFNVAIVCCSMGCSMAENKINANDHIPYHTQSAIHNCKSL